MPFESIKTLHESGKIELIWKISYNNTIRLIIIIYFLLFLIITNIIENILNKIIYDYLINI
jgi:hypothetical protein